MNQHFRTRLPTQVLPFSINHHDRILCLGSCFAQHIGRRLQASKFQLQLNPFGILYNPFSLHQGLQRLLDNQLFTANELFEYQGQWHSFAHHGAFSAASPEAALASINESFEKASTQLSKAKLLILSWGSARVFRHLASDSIVGNCHKLPGQDFRRESLDMVAIVEAWQDLLLRLQAHNPQLQVVVTVSPVRHLRDGLVDNQRSKSCLLLAAAQLEEQLDFVHYFPAYELLMDDLRDYRFYAEDMAHPSEQAVEYIWSYFKSAALAAESLALLPKIDQIRAAAQHRAFDVSSVQHQAFLRKQLEKIERLEREYDFLDFREERLFFENGLHS